jgi:hypothetical protein
MFEGLASEDVVVYFLDLTFLQRFFMAISYINGHLAYFVVIWHIFSRFGTLYQGKSGNPASIREGSSRLPQRFDDGNGLASALMMTHMLYDGRLPICFLFLVSSCM